MSRHFEDCDCPGLVPEKKLKLEARTVYANVPDLKEPLGQPSEVRAWSLADKFAKHD